MNNTKLERINNEFRRQLADIIANDVKDPRKVGMISVIKVDCDNDLKTCKVYLSILGAEGKEKEVVAAINGAQGYIRSQLKQKVQMRAMPELRFLLDDSIQYANKINQILRDIGEIPPEDKE